MLPPRRLEEPEQVFFPCCGPDGLLDGQLEKAKDFPARQCISVAETDGGRFWLIDYASAGKTWDEASTLSVWLKSKNRQED